MKIVQISCSGMPSSGGMGRSAFNHTQALRRDGHQAELYTLPPLPTEAKKISYLFKFGKAAWGARLGQVLVGADVVHLHLPFFGVADSVAAWKKRNPSMLLVATYHMDAVGTGLKSHYIKWWYKNRLKKIIDLCDGIAVTSEDYVSGSHLADYIDVEKCKNMPLRVDTDLFKPALIVQGEPYILFVGGLDEAHYFKGVDILLEAVKKSGITLWIVGDGSKKQAYQKKAARLGISDKVQFKGRLSDEELVRAYQGATALALPSTDGSEAFGLVLIEALACGTPVIASDLPGVRKVVFDSGAGQLVAPGDVESLSSALSRAWGQIPSEEQRMFIARRAAQRYALSTLGRDLIEWYKTIANVV